MKPRKEEEPSYTMHMHTFTPHYKNVSVFCLQLQVVGAAFLLDSLEKCGKEMAVQLLKC